MFRPIWACEPINCTKGLLGCKRGGLPVLQTLIHSGLRLISRIQWTGNCYRWFLLSILARAMSDLFSIILSSVRGVLRSQLG